MNYKKIFKNQQLRFCILKMLFFIPDSIMLKIQYRIKLGRKLNFNKPKRYTEKLQYYKSFYRNDLMPVCVDKYEVRGFVESKGLSCILNDLYGVYSTFEEIDFSILPLKFVIKTTDGGGGENVVICKDKNQLDIESLSKSFFMWKNKKDINAGREWAYTKMKDSKIIIEKYLENDESPEAGISDYKIFCFDGEPHFIVLDVDRYIDHKRNFYDIEWNYLDVSSDCLSFGNKILRPENLRELLNVARKLSIGFPHVRVDLYNLKGEIFFGELTFYPWSGYVRFNPDSFDYILGEKFHLPLKLK